MRDVGQISGSMLDCVLDSNFIEVEFVVAARDHLELMF